MDNTKKHVQFDLCGIALTWEILRELARRRRVEEDPAQVDKPLVWRSQQSIVDEYNARLETERAKVLNDPAELKRREIKRLLYEAFDDFGSGRREL